MGWSWLQAEEPVTKKTMNCNNESIHYKEMSLLLIRKLTFLKNLPPPGDHAEADAGVAPEDQGVRDGDVCGVEPPPK